MNKNYSLKNYTVIFAKTETYDKKRNMKYLINKQYY